MKSLITLALGLVLANGLLGQSSPMTGGSPGLSDLPPLAQYAISAALGRDQEAYHLTPSGDGFRAVNDPQSLSADFTAGGVTVRAGAASFGLRLVAVGRGGELASLPTGASRAEKNRLESRRGTVVEWYVNGPRGLQQGFTLDRAPDGERSRPLTLALASDQEVTVDADRRGATLSRRSGGGTLRYTGLTAYDASGCTLDAHLEMTGGRLLVRVDDAGAVYPVVVDPIFETAKLTASDGVVGDHLGSSIAISRNTVVVGARYHSIGGNTRQGAAYVFVRTGTQWSTMTETAKLTASDGQAFDRLGASVAIRGDTVVVGAWGDDVGSNQNQGAAYVFVKPAAGWVTMTETAKLTASDGAGGDLFGISVAISGDVVIAGARKDDVGGNVDQGSAYVFVKPATGWNSMTETAKFTASDGAADDFLGSAVSISGDTVVVGAWGDDVGSNQDQGAAYVFVMPVTGWSTMTETAKLTASDGAANDTLGFEQAVAIDGDTVVAGAIGHGAEGAAYVFVRPGTGWATMTETAKLTTSNIQGGLFGRAVAISAGTIIVGAPFDATAPGMVAGGSAFVFAKPGTGWATTNVETAKLCATDIEFQDRFGWRVAVSGDRVAISAPHLGNQFVPYAGKAYVHSLATLTGTGSGSIGTTMSLSLSAVGDGGLPYVLASSLGTGPIPIDTRHLDLSVDPLLEITLLGLAPTIFTGYSGSLDPQGGASAAINLPNLPGLVGLDVHTAFVTLNPQAPSDVQSISDTFSFQIQP